MTARELIAIVLRNRPRKDAALSRLGACAVYLGYSRKDVMQALRISKDALSDACITLEAQINTTAKLEEMARKYGTQLTSREKKPDEHCSTVARNEK
jgi:hypothetical protein